MVEGKVNPLKPKIVLLFVLLSVAMLLLMWTDPFLEKRFIHRSADRENEQPNLLMSLVNSYQNVTYIGDIVVENETYLVENMELHLIGNITARNNATVIIRNSKLVLMIGASHREAVELKDTSKFIAENATIYFQSVSDDSSEITITDEAQVNITESSLFGWTYLIGGRNSKVFIANSIAKGPEPNRLREFGIVTRDAANARIENSTIDRVEAREQSSIYVTKSFVPSALLTEGGGIIEIENSDVGSCLLSGNSNIRISNSTLENIDFGGATLYVKDSSVNSSASAYDNSKIWFQSTRVFHVHAYENSTVWLINSGARYIDTSGDGKVYVGWQLPVFGIVVIPHTWILVFQVVFYLAIAVIIIASSVLIVLRWKPRLI